jgi:hypothetical protein
MCHQQVEKHKEKVIKCKADIYLKKKQFVLKKVIPKRLILVLFSKRMEIQNITNC